MLEIGLIGAPGVGKSATASSIANRLSLDVVSSPARRLMNLNVAVGEHGGYLVNLQIAMLRQSSITEQQYGERPYVSVGTLVDTLAYASLSIDDKKQNSPASKVRNELLRETYTAVLIGCMMLDVQPVTHLYYFPVGETASKFQYAVDDAVREVIETYSVPVRVVNSDNASEQILNALETNANS